jgi:predicted NBD/HSP70 family sugar kinase
MSVAVNRESVPQKPVEGNLGSNRGLTRQHNLSVTLRLIHSLDGVSRAQVTRATGLNRSTIGVLVGELSQLGLAVERDLDQAQQQGRPSIMIQPHPGALALSVNPDVDAVNVALVRMGGHIVNAVRFRTVRAPSAAEVVNIVTAIFSGMRTSLPPGHRVLGVGLAVPGLVDAADGTIIEAPRLGWSKEPLSALLAESLGLPVAAANDAVIGARAQAMFGAGRGVADLVYLYGGASGIGGGVISGGRLLQGAGGFAGQLGHTHVRSGGARCTCGLAGCLEAEVTREEIMKVAGLSPEDSDDLENVVMKLLQDPSSATEIYPVLERQIDLLATGLRTVLSLLNPSMIVLGGFLRILARALPDALNAAINRAPYANVAVELAPLSEDPILIGAAELAFEPVIEDPSGYLEAVAGATEPPTPAL